MVMLRYMEWEGGVDREEKGNEVLDYSEQSVSLVERGINLIKIVL